MGLRADGSWVSADGKFCRSRDEYVADHCRDERDYRQYTSGQRISLGQWKQIWPSTTRHRHVMQRLERASTDG